MVTVFIIIAGLILQYIDIFIEYVNSKGIDQVPDYANPGYLLKLEP